MIEIIESYSIHLYSITLLLIIYVLNKLKKDASTFSIKLFYMILFSNVLLLILEPISFISDGIDKSYGFYLNYAVDFSVVLISIVIAGFWASYIDYKFFKKQSRLYQRLFYQHISIITLALLMINFFTPILFHIDPETNVYSRGYLFGIQYVLIFSLYIYIFVMMFKHKNKQNSKVIFGVLLFLLFPILGSIIQAYHNTLHFQFTGMSLGVLVVFLFLETTSGNKDYLTNLYSRRVLDEYMDSLLEYKSEFTLIMIDLDHFKEINDQYSHQAGDEVLIEFSRILLDAKKSKKSLITRLGGDEFLCILLNEDHNESEQFLNRVDELVASNDLLTKYNHFGYSHGVIEYDHQISADDLLKKVDMLMYENKKREKR